jgi:hypothetical protein
MGLYETGRFADVPVEDLQELESAEDVARIVERMVTDLEAHPTEWENYTLIRFLDAWPAVQTHNGSYTSTRAESIPTQEAGHCSRRP